MITEIETYSFYQLYTAVNQYAIVKDNQWICPLLVIGLIFYAGLKTLAGQ